jgi:hypothetical protein
MKNQATLIIGPAEMSGLIREFPEKLFNSDCIALTPDAFEFAKSDYRLQKVIYPKWAQEIRTFKIEDYLNIEARLFRLEDESSRIREQLFSENSNKVDWNYMSNHFLATMLLATRNFFKQAIENLNHYTKIDIISLGHAGEFYFDSCIQSATLCHQMKGLGINVNLIVLDERAKAVTHQTELYETIPNFFSKAFIQGWQSIKKSVLIATSAIYSKEDQKKLALILNGAYSDSIPLIYPLPLWNVLNPSDLFNERCSISETLEQLNEEARSNCFTYSEWLTANTEKSFLEIFDDPSLVDNPFFRAQMNRLHKRHLLQTLTYLGCKFAFGIHKPEMLALTNQDSSINGPLASAAKIHGIELIVFPHSHVVTWPVPCECIVATEWWQPIPTRTLWGDNNQCIYFDTPFYQSLRDYINIKNTNWMIFYNGTQESLYNWVAWPFIQQIVDLVVSQTNGAGVNLSHRLKPGDQTPVKTFCQLLNLDINHIITTLKAPLHDLLINTDLVISVDEPSSGLWEALSLGCAVVLVTDRVLFNESVADDVILKPINFNSFKNLIFSFINNPNALKEYRNQQQKSLAKLRYSRVEIH